MFTRGLNFWSTFWQEPTHASKYSRVAKILTTGQNISNRFDPSIFWVNVFFDKKISHTRSKIQSKFWCQFFALIYWRIFWSCMGPLRVLQLTAVFFCESDTFVGNIYFAGDSTNKKWRFLNKVFLQRIEIFGRILQKLPLNYWYYSMYIVYMYIYIYIYK